MYEDDEGQTLEMYSTVHDWTFECVDGIKDYIIPQDRCMQGRCIAAGKIDSIGRTTDGCVRTHETVDRQAIAQATEQRIEADQEAQDYDPGFVRFFTALL